MCGQEGREAWDGSVFGFEGTRSEILRFIERVDYLLFFCYNRNRIIYS